MIWTKQFYFYDVEARGGNGRAGGRVQRMATCSV